MTAMGTYVEFLEIARRQEEATRRRRAELGMQKHPVGHMSGASSSSVPLAKH